MIKPTLHRMARQAVVAIASVAFLVLETAPRIRW